MCGRFTLATPLPELARVFGAERIDDSLREEPEPPRPRYNIAPTEAIVVLRRADGSGPRELARLRWGLVPEWVEDPSDWPLLINARAESLDEKPAFRDAVRSRRCLVLADGFYEWRAEAGGKQPYYVRLRSGEPIVFAGVWERLRRPDESIESCAIVTTDANELLRPVHDRMPVILPPEAHDRWLDPGVEAYDELRDALRPLPSEALVTYPVSRRVNRIENDDPSCIEPIAEAGTGGGAGAGRTGGGAGEARDRARGEGEPDSRAREEGTRNAGGRESGTRNAGGRESGTRDAGSREGDASSPQLELL